VQMGEYKPGNDPLADEAVAKIEDIRGFLNQATSDLWSFEKTIVVLTRIAGKA